MAGVGMPDHLLLERWAAEVQDALGGRAYLVGSAVLGKEWRDVDVRLMLDDDAFDRWFPAARPINRNDRLWSLLCAAIALHGRRVTGLPIDFQIQRTSDANEQHSGPRDPLVLRIAARGDCD